MSLCLLLFFLKFEDDVIDSFASINQHAFASINQQSFMLLYFSVGVSE